MQTTGKKVITRVPGLTYAPCKPTITICICLGAYYSVSSSIQNTALGNIGSIVAMALNWLRVAVWSSRLRILGFARIFNPISSPSPPVILWQKLWKFKGKLYPPSLRWYGSGKLRVILHRICNKHPLIRRAWWLHASIFYCFILEWMCIENKNTRVEYR